jgi:TPR repeat protein
MWLSATFGSLKVKCCRSILVALTATILVAGQGTAQSTPLLPDQVSQLTAKAEGGDADAQVKLGIAYEDGNGVPKNDAVAFKWYLAAAQQGNATAQNNVGLMYRSGSGVERNKVEALKWYRMAAKQRNASAMFNLGTAYYNGDGTGVDDSMAYLWFLLAKSYGSQAAIAAVERMEQEAKAAQSGALEQIGDMYARGDELPRDPNEALAWYRKAAAEVGDTRVQVKLALLLLTTQKDGVDYSEARNLCEKAATHHDAMGVYCVGELYAQGLGVERDAQKAAKHFLESANLGYGVGAYRIGLFYWNGEGVKQNKVSAYEYMLLAASSRLPQAENEQARMEKELTPAEIKKAQKKVQEWSQQHSSYPPLVLKKQAIRDN